MRNERPQPDKGQPHKIRKQQWGHRRTVHKLVEDACPRFNQIGAHMEPEAQYADEGLTEHDHQANVEKSARNGDCEKDEKETRGEGGRDDWNPLRSGEESVRCMIGQRENKVSKEAAKREQDHPSSPLRAARCHHAVHEQQKAEPGIGQRRCKRRRIGEALEGSIEKESAFEVIENAAKSNQNREPTDQVA